VTAKHSNCQSSDLVIKKAAAQLLTRFWTHNSVSHLKNTKQKAMISGGLSPATAHRTKLYAATTN
jgi:hypothetical protein